MFNYMHGGLVLGVDQSWVRFVKCNLFPQYAEIQTMSNCMHGGLVLSVDQSWVLSVLSP